MAMQAQQQKKDGCAVRCHTNTQVKAPCRGDGSVSGACSNASFLSDIGPIKVKKSSYVTCQNIQAVRIHENDDYVKSYL
jgi:hypothetical protein